MEVGVLYDSAGEAVKNLMKCPISQELEVFARLLYRNKNQHRRERQFQKLVRISKDTKKYHEFNVAERIKKLQRLLAKYRFNLGGTNSTNYHLDEEVQCVVAELSQQISQCCVLLKKVLTFCEATFWEIQQYQLVPGLFVPFYLMMCATISRIWAFLLYHVKYLLQLHETLTAWKDDKKTIGVENYIVEQHDIGESVTLDASFMEARKRDFLTSHCLSTTSQNKAKESPKESKKHIERSRSSSHHRWRTASSFYANNFCGGYCWMRLKKNRLKRRKKVKRCSRVAAVIDHKNIKLNNVKDNFIDTVFGLLET